MSQDIRSFFIRTPKGNEKKETVKEPENKKRNRKRIVLDSDSDEEPVTKVSKIEKKSPKGKPSQKKTPVKKNQSPVKSKFVEVPQKSIADLLGKKPVKRVPQPQPKIVNENKNSKDDEFGDDEDFEAAFQQLDEIEDGDWFIGKEDKNNKKTSHNDSKSEPTKKQEKTSPQKMQSPKKDNSDISHKKPKLEVTNEKSPEKKSPLEKFKKKLPSMEKVTKEESPPKKNSPTKEQLFNNVIKKECCPVKPSMEDNEKAHKNKNGEISKETKLKKMKDLKKQEDSHNHSPKANHKVNGNESKSRPLIGKKHYISPPSSPSPRKPLYEVDESVEREKFDLWVEKYKPTNLKQIIGQQGEKSNVNKLLKWLKDWYNNHNGSKKLTKPSPWAKDDSGAYFKAALLSGSPGVGKTTTTHLVCKELNLDVVEFNASDTRSKKMLSDEVSELLSTKSLSHFVHGNGEVSRKHILVMDEVDGMAGNEDRGGVQELIHLIKNSKIPIICMCNDRNHPKIRSLVNYCFDLRFQKPRVDQIKGAMMTICFKEKLKIKPEVMNEIITTTNQDIRLILNHLSILAAKSTGNMEVTSKHIKLGPWDVLRKVFSEEEHKKMSLYDKSDLFFHDYSVAPLFVHENYLLVVPHSQESKTKLGKMELFSKAISSLCTGDLIESAIRRNNAWSLLPVQAMFSSVIPGEALEGHVGGQISFPAWFGKNSRRSKLDRLSQELQIHTRLKTSGSKEAMKLDYCKPLREEITRPLVERATEGIREALAFLHSYDLLREDLEALSDLNNWPMTHDPFTNIDSKVKAAFTRAYNKTPVMTPFSIIAPIKKGRGGGGGMEEEYGEEGDGDEEANHEEEDDDMTADGMIVMKKKTEKKTGKKEKKTEKKDDAGTPKQKKGGGRGRRKAKE